MLILKLVYFSAILIANTIIFVIFYELILNKDLLIHELEILGNWNEIKLESV